MNTKEKAFLVADKAHSNQSYDIYPYGYHIRHVVRIAEELGYDESIIVACILHDTLEDTSLSYNDIKNSFGEEVAEIVYCVTDELGRNRKERKEKTYPKIKNNYKAVIVKICDRIANIEHSKKEGNKSLLEMYKKEHALFKEMIHNEHVEIVRAWNKLENVFS